MSASVRVRAALSLGVAAALGVVPTSAYFQANAAVPGVTFKTGTVNLTVGLTSYADNYTDTTEVSGLVAGESVATQVSLRNAGTVPVTWRASGVATGALTSKVTYRLYSGGGATNTSSNGVRSGSCAGTARGSAQALATTVSLTDSATTLAAQSATTVCLLVTMRPTAPAAAPESTSPTITFSAIQARNS